MKGNDAQSMSEPGPDALGGRTPLDWPRQAGQIDGVMAAIEVRERRQRQRRRRASLAGAAALLVAGTGWFAWSAIGRGPLDSQAADTIVVAQPERRTLPDGTRVELKPGAQIAVDFRGALRRVALRSGEAHFQVTKNPERAFVVDAGGMEFRAVGTAFAVQLSGTKVEMLVTEGRVAVEAAQPITSAASPAAESPTPKSLAMVDAGSSVALDLGRVADVAAVEVTQVSSAESGERLAWRVPRIELSDTPLAAAVAALNRHSAVTLEVGDAALNKVSISGVLRADNVEPLLRMLEENYQIRADRVGPDKIVLRKGRR